MLRICMNCRWFELRAREYPCRECVRLAVRGDAHAMWQPEIRLTVFEERKGTRKATIEVLRQCKKCGLTEVNHIGVEKDGMNLVMSLWDRVNGCRCPDPGTPKSYYDRGALRVFDERKGRR